MATRTVTALFESYATAAAAVRELETLGVAHEDISIVSNDVVHASVLDAPTGEGQAPSDGTLSGTGAGASLGTLLGGGAGLLAGLGLLAIPGLGPVMAAGWFASTLVGAGVGAAAGGLVGSLTDAGLSETDAEAYADGLTRGGTLVTVRVAGMMIEPVAEILAKGGTIDLARRAPPLLGTASTEAPGAAPEITPVGDPALAEAGVVPQPETERDLSAQAPLAARPGSTIAGDVGANLPAGSIGVGDDRIGIFDKP